MPTGATSPPQRTLPTAIPVATSAAPWRRVARPHGPWQTHDPRVRVPARSTRSSSSPAARDSSTRSGPPDPGHDLARLAPLRVRASPRSPRSARTNALQHVPPLAARRAPRRDHRRHRQAERNHPAGRLLPAGCPSIRQEATLAPCPLPRKSDATRPAGPARSLCSGLVPETQPDSAQSAGIPTPPPASTIPKKPRDLQIDQPDSRARHSDGHAEGRGFESLQPLLQPLLTKPRYWRGFSLVGVVRGRLEQAPLPSSWRSSATGLISARTHPRRTST
jgi:hypothetical protein